MGNKVTIKAPKKVITTNADGVESVDTVMEDHTLTGRQFKQHMKNWGNYKVPSGLLRNLLSRAGCIKINEADIDDVVVSVPESQGV